MARTKRNKKHNKSKFGITGWLIAGLLAIGGGYGVWQSDLLNFGGGSGSGDSNGNGAVTETTNNAGEEENVEDITITVAEAHILWNDESITPDELTERVEETADSAEYLIVDDSAIKASYDEVIRTLNANNAEFNEALVQ